MKCQYSKCGKSFESASKKSLYCSPNCRKYAHAEKKAVPGGSEVEFLVLRNGLKVRATEGVILLHFRPLFEKWLPAEAFDVVAAAERVVLNAKPPYVKDVENAEKKLASPIKSEDIPGCGVIAEALAESKEHVYTDKPVQSFTEVVSEDPIVVSQGLYDHYLHCAKKLDDDVGITTQYEWDALYKEIESDTLLMEYHKTDLIRKFKNNIK